MLKRISLIFSICFHPLLMPTLGIVLILYADSYVAFIPMNAKKWLIILTSIGTLILPAVMMPVFLLQGKISDFQLDERRERILPLIFTSIFYLLTFLLFKKIPVFRFLHAFIFGSFVLVLIASLISIKWKISTHMIGLGGITGLVLMASFTLDINFIYALIGIIIAAGLTGSSRIYLKAHNLKQVYSGYALGLIIMMLNLMVYVR